MNSLVSAAKVEAVVGAFKRVRDDGDTALKSKSKQVKKRWGPPPSGTYKINVDATIHEESQTVGLRVVVREVNGKIVMAVLKTMPFRGEARYSKAEAVEWVFRLQQKQKCTR